MGTWVLWGVLRSQWANPLYIPLTWPDITIHFCHSTNIIIINHSISENCRKSHIFLSVENSFTQKLLELHADWFSVLKVQIYLILRENIIFCFIKFEKLLSWAWWYLFEYTENTRQGADREKCEASWYHHLIFTLSGADSTGSIIPIETGIFNMKIPQVLFKIIQP